MALSKNQKMQFAERFREFMSEVAEEKFQEVETFLKKEIEPNAPGIMAFTKHLNFPEDLHPTHGLNGHPLVCGRCNRMTPVAIPLGKYNALWECSQCGVQTHGVEDDFLKCPQCESLMTRIKVHKPGSEISMDYNCKTCRENKKEQIEIAQKGGAIVLCPKCHTTGTLPATDKEVIKFRKDNNLPPNIEIRFLLVDTQCPRCADEAAARVFTELEQKRIFLHHDDLANGYFRKADVTGPKGGKKSGATRKSNKSAKVVGVPEPETDEVKAPKPEVLFPHPGTKAYH